MKKIGFVIAGFIGGLVFMLIIGATVVQNQIFLVDESKYGFIETIDKIEELSKENGWNISHIYNLQATMAKHNLEVQPVVVLSLCKPQIAYYILGSDTERPASALMPCRVSVYETKEGKVMVSRMNVSFMSSILSGVSKDALVMAGKENESILKHILK